MTNKERVIHRATEDFKNLVIYYNVTRPQHINYYKGKDGKFDHEKFVHELCWLDKWKLQTQCFKKANAIRYSRYRRNFNYTFDIHSDIVKQILGQWCDENGKRHHLRYDEVIQPILDSGFCKKLNMGKSFRISSDSEGNDVRTLQCHWHNKYILDSETRERLMSDKRYASLYTIPGISARLVRIIKKHDALFNDNASYDEVTREELAVAYLDGTICQDEFVLSYASLFCDGLDPYDAIGKAEDKELKLREHELGELISKHKELAEINDSILSDINLFKSRLCASIRAKGGDSCFII